MSADLYFTGILSSFIFRQLISELTERNSTTTGHMHGSKCNLKKHVQNLGIPSLYKLGAQNHLFGSTSQLNSNFHGLYLWNETRYRQSFKCVDKLQGVSYIAWKQHELWSTNSFKLHGPPFYPPYVNSVFYTIARLRRRRSANGT